MTRPMRPTVLLFVVLMSACSTLTGGISREEAIRVARREAPGQVSAVVSASYGPLGRFIGPGTLPGEPRERVVWAIVFRGTFPPVSCGPAPPPGQMAHCPPDAHTALVVLDYETGEFILGSVPADAG